jgi:hypothetical protein
MKIFPHNTVIHRIYSTTSTDPTTDQRNILWPAVPFSKKISSYEKILLLWQIWYYRMGMIYYHRRLDHDRSIGGLWKNLRTGVVASSRMIMWRTSWSDRVWFSSLLSFSYDSLLQEVLDSSIKYKFRVDRDGNRRSWVLRCVVLLIVLVFLVTTALLLHYILLLQLLPLLEKSKEEANRSHPPFILLFFIFYFMHKMTIVHVRRRRGRSRVCQSLRIAPFGISVWAIPTNSKKTHETTMYYES